MGNGSTLSTGSHALHKVIAGCNKLMIYPAKSKAITKHREKRYTANSQGSK